MKGICEIQLIDNATGEVMQSTKDENMLTNAIANILNPPPLFFAEGGDYAGYMRTMAGSMDRLLGGVMLWSEPIEENPDIIYPPNPEAQVGYAGNNAYTGENAFRGSYNAIESGRTYNGYKHVWDFPSSAANGTIKCVTATSGLGGRCGWGGDTTQKMNYMFGIATACPDKHSTVTDYVQAGVFCTCIAPDTYVYLKLINAKTIDLVEVKFPTYNMKTSDPSIFSKSINRNYNDCTTTRITTEKNIVYSTNVQYFSVAKATGDIMTLFNPVSTTSVIITKINVVTKELVSQTTVTTPNNDQNNIYSYGGAVEHDGFLYITSSSFDTLRAVYKIDITDNTKVTNIPLPKDGAASYCALNVLNGRVILSPNPTADSCPPAYFINEDDTVTPCLFGVRDSGTQFQITLSQFINAPFYMASGLGYTYGSYDSRMLVGLILPYLATINNLATPIQKTASQSMKVIYTFTDIEEGEVV